jgi:hypothetical protein
VQSPVLRGASVVVAVCLAVVACDTPGRAPAGKERRAAEAARAGMPLPRPSQQPSLGIITSDRFIIVHSLQGDTLNLSVDTDLPDFTDVIVNIHRGFLRTHHDEECFRDECGNTKEYFRDYFSEKSTIGRWRQPRHINVSHDIFKKDLREVVSVEPDLEIDFVVPMRQSNAAFAELNSNLIGTATRPAADGRVVTAETTVSYPFDAELR